MDTENGIVKTRSMVIAELLLIVVSSILFSIVVIALASYELFPKEWADFVNGLNLGWLYNLG